MLFQVQSLLPFLLLSSIHALPATPPTAKPPFFVLIGDSTTAHTQAWNGTTPPGGGGWGDGFLSTQSGPTPGVNDGRNGQTTVSYREKGYWALAVAEIIRVRPTRQVYVTVQFGHNDQKPEKGISTAQLEANLEGMVKELTGLGAKVIVVTSLSRRNFIAANRVSDSLANEAKAARQAAFNTKVSVIDLNAASKKYVEAIGKTQAVKLNADYRNANDATTSRDNTHLNHAGSMIFGRMVADLIVAEVPALAKWTHSDPNLSTAIKLGRLPVI